MLKLHKNGAINGAATIYLDRPMIRIIDVSDYLERRVLILYAGALGETLTAGHVPGQGVDNAAAVSIIRGDTARQDHAKAREAIHLIRNIRFPNSVDQPTIDSELEKIEKQLWLRATQLVEQFEDLIVGVSRTLLQELSCIGEAVVLNVETLNSLPSFQGLPRLDPDLDYP
ncbi:hypothetical protein HX805_26450 [Pseudomonas sp. G5001]|uniref:hypothetical protein n=1 Tax=Pseudomonas sp. G5001 TaxID=2738824 RepID=UPI0015A18AA0|nr:hypothetical protein [Pseudomonas sp. G5001]NWB76018.1 hypothetical protein [Pseudomonas sp. G5001]